MVRSGNQGVAKKAGCNLVLASVVIRNYCTREISEKKIIKKRKWWNNEAG